AGFFSKDAIIDAALGTGGVQGPILAGAALLGAGITAFYMTRVMVMTFFGKRRWEIGVHPHEAPAVMTWPMILLAIGSVFSGGLLTVGGVLQRWLQPVVGSHEAAAVVPVWVSTVITLAVVAVGIAVAYRMYVTRPVPVEPPADVGPLTVAARRDLYGDAINEDLFMRPGAQLTHALVEVDNRGIDGAVNGLAAGIGRISRALRLTQTGFARSYALSMLAGAALVVALILAVRLW
ncbi:MAG TPA: NADH-quinone oxidoreductase subunit L, partial [Mycobacterium sp.]|nr:NADH-quinone oxidoreductase subunit L [Mycobacterium sp.]